MRILDLETPALILDLAVLERNCAAMAERAKRHEVRLRPHIKTAKSAEVATIATRGQFGGLTVSTVAEAAYFAAHQFRDLTYGVGIAPDKIPALAAIQRAHEATISLIVDSVAATTAVAECAAMEQSVFPVLIEIDTGGRRAGLDPEDPELLAVAQAVAESKALRLSGVLSHAGHSYHAHGPEEIRRIAEQERSGVVRAARRITAAGLPCETVSVGSTPTAVYAERLDGVTEMRPGVYTFFDLDQVGLGVCTENDIVVSVLATVIGHNRRSNRILIDAGALALSKDLSASEFTQNVGYGLIRPVRGAVLPPAHLFVAEVHQEHGQIAAAESELPWDDLPIGAKVRVLPNHACLTVAPFDRYHVDRGDGLDAVQWEKIRGW
ncbi:MAG: alanine racemase [Verrucomicrobia bacterium]|nr:alanine racemase [Verrucomicrobiota bacterium]MBV8279340.1 alanine racemase [Verrucomicrobiota bacterium]